MLVETMYNKLAINTGFPLYIDETSTPETTRFLLEMLAQSLLNTIDNVYISQNVLEKRIEITTQPGIDHYAVEGMVKSIQYVQNQGQLSGNYIPFNLSVDEPGVITKVNKLGPPRSYVMDQGEIRFFPIPDKAYKIRVTTSTTDLVWANDDTSRNIIEDIKDSVMAPKEFCDIVILKACAFTLGRCNNKAAEFYNNLATQRLKTFLERDNNTLERPHLYDPRAGHYNNYTGLMGNQFPRRRDYPGTY